MPMEEVGHILFQVLTIVETQSRGKLGTLTWQTLGVALEVYRSLVQPLSSFALLNTLQAPKFTGEGRKRQG